MGKTSFDIGEIYGAISSYKGLPSPIGIGEWADYKYEQFNNRAGILSGERDVNNMYGVPVVMAVTINGVILGSGEDENKHITIQPMISYEGKKRIVSNAVGGGSYPGTIKEFINMDDYRINIVGCVINKNQKEYPHAQVDLMRELWKINEAISFDCAITNDLFDHIVIKRLKFKELLKSPGIQMYELEALSDAAVEIELLKG